MEDHRDSNPKTLVEISDSKEKEKKLAQNIAATFTAQYEYTSSWSTTFGSKKYRALSMEKINIYNNFIQKLKSFNGDLPQVMGIINDYVEKILALRTKYLKKGEEFCRELNEKELKMVKTVLKKENTRIPDDKTIRSKIKTIYVERNLQPAARLEKNFLTVFESLKKDPQFNDKYGALYEGYKKSLQDFLPPKQAATRPIGFQIKTSSAGNFGSGTYDREGFEAVCSRAKSSSSRSDNIFSSTASAVKTDEAASLISSLLS